jgi:hypothetical protein
MLMEEQRNQTDHQHNRVSEKAGKHTLNLDSRKPGIEKKFKEDQMQSTSKLKKNQAI